MLWLMMGKEPKGLRIEIESKIEYHPVLEPLCLPTNQFVDPD